MAGFDLTNDPFIFDPQQGQRYAFSSRSTWPLQVDQNLPQDDQNGEPQRRNTTNAAAETAITTTDDQSAAMFAAASNFNRYGHPVSNAESNALLADWTMPPSAAAAANAAAAAVTYAQNPPALNTQMVGGFGAPFQPSPIDYIPTTQAQLEANLPMDTAFASVDTLSWSWEDFGPTFFPYDGQNQTQGMQTGDLTQQNAFSPAVCDGSPTDTFLEARSLTSSGSEAGWAYVDHHRYEPYMDSQRGAISNPGQTLHVRTASNSSSSEAAVPSRSSLDSGEEFVFPMTSPELESKPELANQQPLPTLSPQAGSQPLEITSSSHSSSSPSSQSMSSPPSQSSTRVVRKSSANKNGKASTRRQSNAAAKETEKRIGRRRGPLKPDQRKQASAIRKLGACLRCRFLKKLCDQGSPCTGCQPAHARLWQVPCTRIDIKELGYFMKDWKADYERYVTVGVSVGNIKNFSPVERVLDITHGYGHSLPVKCREIYVRDENCFLANWVESIHESPLAFEVDTAALTVGSDGISHETISHYLDLHIDNNFEEFVDEYFEGTKFLSDIIKTAFRYYQQSNNASIRKALKLLIAYNLTLHVTLVEGLPENDPLNGKVTDPSSKYFGQTVAPVMINVQVKYAMAEMWRTLQRETLEDLSALYAKTWSGDRLKNWPVILFLATILLVIWEEMQFDTHFRVEDPATIDKFCNEMEGTPVGVMVGLFSALSTKLPSFNEWDTRKHHQSLNSDAAVCEAMTEIQQNVCRNEDYLKSQSAATYDKNDFDCLSNKFLSKLVIRAN